MNTPLDPQQSACTALDRQIDRLVDGELPDSQRRELLMQFESQGDGWRRCALAFLEAQTCQEALSPGYRRAYADPTRFTAPQQSPHKHGHWRAFVKGTAAAAAFVAAFALGRVSLSGPSAHSTEAQPMNAQAAGSSIRPESARTATNDFVAQPKRPTDLAEGSAELDPIVKRLEQQGFQAEMQKRLVSMELKDGRKFDVPIQEVRVRYVAGRTY